MDALQKLRESLEFLDQVGPTETALRDVSNATISSLVALSGEQMLELSEFMRGKRFPASEHLANEVLLAAERLEPEKAMYLRARTLAQSNSAEAISLFRKVAATGHLASMFYWSALVHRQLPPLIGGAFRVTTIIAISAWSFFSVFSTKFDYRFWKYKDVTRRPIELVENKLKPIQRLDL